MVIQKLYHLELLQSSEVGNKQGNIATCTFFGRVEGWGSAGEAGGNLLAGRILVPCSGIKPTPLAVKA